MMAHRILLRVSVAFAVGLLASAPVYAQKAYGPGVTDTEIKLGQSTRSAQAPGAPCSAISRC
jgi:hypothetical protein